MQGTVSTPEKVRKTAIGGRPRRDPCHEISVLCGKPIEEDVGWIRAKAGYNCVKVRGKAKVTAGLTFAVSNRSSCPDSWPKPRRTDPEVRRKDHRAENFPTPRSQTRASNPTLRRPETQNHRVKATFAAVCQGALHLIP